MKKILTLALFVLLIMAVIAPDSAQAVVPGDVTIRAI